MERRDFLKKAMAFAGGILALAKIREGWAKGLPSDPDVVRIEAGQNIILLPPFEKNSPFSLDQALLGRRSSRSFDGERSLSKEDLSRLLWAATGVNRPDGKRTVASARARYPVEILAALPNGVFRYEPREHRLVRIIAEDIREKIPSQEAFKRAAMQILYVIHQEKVPDRIEFADIEIGFIGQGLYLEAAALGLGSCMYASVRTEVVAKLLGLKENQILRIAQAVGPTR